MTVAYPIDSLPKRITLRPTAAVPGKTLKFTRLAALIITLVLIACAGAPVQEMSNARQAVMAAQQMGAEHGAARELAEARRLLDVAQAALDRGDYSTARSNAERARAEAVKALRLSQNQSPGSPSPP